MLMRVMMAFPYGVAVKISNRYSNKYFELLWGKPNKNYFHVIMLLSMYPDLSVYLSLLFSH